MYSAKYNENNGNYIFLTKPFNIDNIKPYGANLNNNFLESNYKKSAGELLNFVQGSKETNVDDLFTVDDKIIKIKKLNKKKKMKEFNCNVPFELNGLNFNGSIKNNEFNNFDLNLAREKNIKKVTKIKKVLKDEVNQYKELTNKFEDNLQKNELNMDISNDFCGLNYNDNILYNNFSHNNNLDYCNHKSVINDEIDCISNLDENFVKKISKNKKVKCQKLKDFDNIEKSVKNLSLNFEGNSIMNDNKTVFSPQNVHSLIDKHNKDRHKIYPTTNVIRSIKKSIDSKINPSYNESNNINLLEYLVDDIKDIEKTDLDLNDETNLHELNNNILNNNFINLDINVNKLHSNNVQVSNESSKHKKRRKKKKNGLNFEIENVSDINNLYIFNDNNTYSKFEPGNGVCNDVNCPNDIDSILASDNVDNVLSSRDSINDTIKIKKRKKKKVPTATLR